MNNIKIDFDNVKELCKKEMENIMPGSYEGDKKWFESFWSGQPSDMQQEDIEKWIAVGIAWNCCDILDGIEEQNMQEYLSDKI